MLRRPISIRILTLNGAKTLTLKDIVLYRAFAETEGGAVRSFGNLYVTNSKFISNRSNAGEAPFIPTDLLTLTTVSLARTLAQRAARS